VGAGNLVWPVSLEVQFLPHARSPILQFERGAMRRGKPRTEWSVPYRQRMERAERKAREQGVPFNRSTARGHGVNEKGETEYQRRKASEKARAGKYYPLTPANVRQLKKFGAKEPDLLEAMKIPKTLRDELLRQQRYYYNHPEDPRNITVEDMHDEFPDVPDVFFYYHAWR
jgi:hypothetical protein